MLINGAKLPELVQYFKVNKIKFKKDPLDKDTVFNIFFDERWVPLKKDTDIRGALQADTRLTPLIMNFMQRKPTKVEEPVLPGCTFDTTKLEGKSFSKCPGCGLLVIPGLPHPTTKTLANGKIVYV